MSTVVVGTYTLGGINVALNGAVVLVVPLLAQVDVMLTGSFGLGGLLGDLSAQLNAALAAQVQLSLQVSNPFEVLQAWLRAALQVQASIAASLALGIPDLTVSASLSASAAISAALALKVGGLQALIRLVLSLKLPIVNAIGAIQANLSAGPFVLMSVGFAAPSTLASSVSEYSALVSGGVGGILPSDQVFGVIILTKSPSASAALSATLKTS